MHNELVLFAEDVEQRIQIPWLVEIRDPTIRVRRSAKGQRSVLSDHQAIAQGHILAFHGFNGVLNELVLSRSVDISPSIAPSGTRPRFRVTLADGARIERRAGAVRVEVSSCPGVILRVGADDSTQLTRFSKKRYQLLEFLLRVVGGQMSALGFAFRNGVLISGLCAISDEISFGNPGPRHPLGHLTRRSAH